MFIEAGFFQHADFYQMLFDHFTDFSDQAGDVFAAFFEVAAAGVKHAVQLFHQKGDIAAFAEYGGHDAGEGDYLLEELKVACPQ